MEMAVEVAQSAAWGHSSPSHQNRHRFRTRRPHHTHHIQNLPHTCRIRLRCARVFSHLESASVPETALFLYPLACAYLFSLFFLLRIRAPEVFLLCKHI